MPTTVFLQSLSTVELVMMDMRTELTPDLMSLSCCTKVALSAFSFSRCVMLPLSILISCTTCNSSPSPWQGEDYAIDIKHHDLLVIAGLLLM